MSHPLKRNNLIVGLLVGLIFPGVVFLVLTLINDSFADPNTMDGFRGFNLKGRMILSIIINVAPFEIYKRRNLNQSMTGVIGATIALGLLMAGVLFLG
jgi:hypothetical protein